MSHMNNTPIKLSRFGLIWQRFCCLPVLAQWGCWEDWAQGSAVTAAASSSPYQGLDWWSLSQDQGFCPFLELGLKKYIKPLKTCESDKTHNSTFLEKCQILQFFNYGCATKAILKHGTELKDMAHRWCGLYAVQNKNKPKHCWRLILSMENGLVVNILRCILYILFTYSYTIVILHHCMCFVAQNREKWLKWL